KKIESLTEQFEDLKTAILTSIGSSNEREVARGVVKYRRLIDFIKGLKITDDRILTHCKDSWDELLSKHADIKQIVDLNSLNPNQMRNIKMKGQYIVRGRTFLIKSDDSFFELRFSIDVLNDLSLDW